MPPKNFLDTASSKKKFEAYKQRTRRNSASSATSNIPNPEDRYIGPAERTRLLKEKRKTERLMIDKMITNTREDFPPIAGSSKQQEQQSKQAQNQKATTTRRAATRTAAASTLAQP